MERLKPQNLGLLVQSIDPSLIQIKGPQIKNMDNFNKITSSIGSIGGGLMGAIGSSIDAWNSVLDFKGKSETLNNINLVGNAQYEAGDLGNLSNQITNTLAIQTSGLTSVPQLSFGDYASTALKGAQAGMSLGSSISDTVASFAALGGPLHRFDLGGTIGLGVGGLGLAALNTGLIAGAQAKLKRLKNEFDEKAQMLNTFATARNNFNADIRIHDSLNQMIDLNMLSMKAYGGPLGTWWNTFDNGVRVINEGGTHEQNPFEGVPQGIAPDGQPNLVEEGEVVYNDYVYSNRLKLNKTKAKELFGLSGGLTFADAAKKLQRESEERPNDPISKKGLEDSMNKLKAIQEELKEAKRLKEISQLQFLTPQDLTMGLESIPQQSSIDTPMFANGGHLFKKGGNKNSVVSKELSESLKSLAASMIQPTLDLTYKPVDRLQEWSTQYEQIKALNPKMSQAQILKEMFPVNERATQALINRTKQEIIDRAIEIGTTRKAPGLALTTEEPESKAAYKQRLVEGGWKASDADREVERAWKKGAWMTDSCAATVTEGIYDAMAEHYPLELVKSINGGSKNRRDSKGNNFFGKDKGNIFNLSVSNLIQTARGTNDVYDVITPQFDERGNLINGNPGDIAAYMHNGNQGHAYAFLNNDENGTSHYFLSWGGLGPTSVGEGTRGMSNGETNGNFTLGNAGSNREGVQPAQYLLRYNGNNRTNEYDAAMAQLNAIPVDAMLALGIDPSTISVNDFWESPTSEITYPIPTAILDATRVEPPAEFTPIKIQPQLTMENIGTDLNNSTISSPTFVIPRKLRANGGHLFAGTNVFDTSTLTWADSPSGSGPMIYDNGLWATLGDNFDLHGNYSNLRYVNALNEVKDAAGNVTQAAVPGHYEIIKGDGAQPMRKSIFNEVMRATPVIGAFAQALAASGKKPTYEHQDAAIRAAGLIPYVNSTPVSSNPYFKFLSPYEGSNSLRSIYSQALNNSLNLGGSRAAVMPTLMGLLASLTKALGDTRILNEQYNNTLRGTNASSKYTADAASSQAAMLASAANAQRAQLIASMIGAMAPQKQTIDDTIYSNTQNTLANAFNLLGNYGTDRLNRGYRDFLLERGVYPGVSSAAEGGKLNYRTNRKRK